MNVSFPRPLAAAARSVWRSALLLLPLAALSCGDGSSNDAAAAAGVGSTGGSSGALGTTGGRSGGGVGGHVAGGGGAGGRSGAGASGVGSSQGGAAQGGSTPVQAEGGSGGDDDAPAGGAAGGGPGGDNVPGPRPDGSSAYAIECRGDSLDCKDAALRCLGLRDGNAVLGYACSNQCQTAADCSAAPSGAEATAGCVDFALSKHCVLVCQQGASQRTCPTGMSCYVYPGTELGYCLWR